MSNLIMKDMSLEESKRLRIPFEDIKSATNNFGHSHCIGESVSGKVYKGHLPQAGGMVAIKLISQYFLPRVEFWDDMRKLYPYRHKNLVSLLGFAFEEDVTVLVYEYVSNKSLDQYLSSNDLSWNQRLVICIGVARGINYLHGSQQQVLHRDIKSSSILLDQNWNAKIGFTFHSTFVDDESSDSLSINEYPESSRTVVFTDSDVYSFGVVLFEVICRRSSGQRRYPDVRLLRRHPDVRLLKLLELAKKNYNIILETSMKDQISPVCLERCLTVTCQCLQQESKRRPSIVEVVQELEIALRYQEEYENEEESDTDEGDFWETKLPQGWKGLITKFNIPRAIYTIKGDLFSLLHKGILFDEGNKFLWITNDGTKCLQISAKRFIELNEGSDHRWVFEHDSSRFPVVVDYLYGKWHEIRCQIKTSMLSLGTMYAANLVFKYSKKSNEDLKHLRLMTIRWKVEELSIHSTHYAELIQDDWYKIRMWNFVNQLLNANFDIKIEELSYYDNPVESGLLIQGIEFQPIEMMRPTEIERTESLLTIDEVDTNDDLYWENKLPNDYQQYIEISNKSLHYTSKQELYILLCTGFLAYGGKLFLSLCKSTGGICSILPAKHILCKDRSYKSLETLTLSESRFREVKELGNDDWYIFTCRLRPFMFSPNYIYACYLLFKCGDNPSPDNGNPESWTGLGIRKSLGLPFKSTKQSGMRYQLRQKLKNKFGDNQVLSNNGQFFKVEYKLGDIIRGTVIGHMNSTPLINIPTIMPKNDHGAHDDLSSIEASGMRPKGHMDIQNSWLEERNDGWMEVRLSKSLHQLEKQVSLEVKLWKPEGGSLSGIIVEGIEFRPMQELSDF